MFTGMLYGIKTVLENFFTMPSWFIFTYICFSNAHCCIGHSRITHKCLLIGEEFPLCQSLISLKLILMGCDGFNSSRILYFLIDSFKMIFNEVWPDLVLDFLSNVNYKVSMNQKLR